MPPSQDHVPEELRSPAIQAELLNALERAYEVSQERHDPEVGDDAITFGIHVWKSGAYFLSAAFGTVPGAAAKIVNQSLSIRMGSIELRHHKLGDSELDNPLTSFPNHVGPASRMPGRAQGVQLDLPIPEDEAEASQVYLDWVIGSYGNPDDGLRAVRLQAVGPQRALDGTIARWEHIYTIFDASVGAAFPVSAALVANPAAVIEITPEPSIELQIEEGERHIARP